MNATGFAPAPAGRHVDIGDTRLFIEERGAGYPLIVLHGGPGLDHHIFADYLDALTDRFQLILVDQRSQGRSDQTPEATWTLEQMAADVTALAAALGLERYAVLGHSYGAFVALQHAVDFPGAAAQSIISSGVAAAHHLECVARNLAAFEPQRMRERVTTSWEKEKDAETQEDVAALLHDQFPFHFADPLDTRIAEFERRSVGAVYAPNVLRYFARNVYGGIEVGDRLAHVTQPVLVLAGRYDRTCPVEAAEEIAAGVPNGKLVVFERSGHMTYVEENAAYRAAVREFLLENGAG